MTETLANWYSSESTQRELNTNMVWMVFKNLCVLVLREKVASAVEGLSQIFHKCSIVIIFPSVRDHENAPLENGFVH